MDQLTFGGELRRRREQRGLSLKKFAHLVHYDPGYLSKIENGLKPPTATLAEACDAALDTGGTLSTLLSTPAEPKSSQVTHEGVHLAEEPWPRLRTIALNISDQVGMRKPDLDMFALARLDLPAEQCVFMDDVARYLPPARALGMATIHATDPATTVTELEQLFGDHPLHPTI